MYRTEADAGLGGRSLLYPRGKVLGGSSSINGMIYMRGQARRLRPLGRADRRRQLALVVGAAAVQKKRGLSRRRFRTARRRRCVARGKAALVVEDTGRVSRCGGADRYPEGRRFQSRRQRRLRLFRSQSKTRHPLEYGEGVFETGVDAAQPDHHDRLPRGTFADRNERSRTRVQGRDFHRRRHAVQRNGRERNPAGGWVRWFSTDFAMLRNRLGRALASAWHRAVGGLARRRRKPAGSSATAHDLQAWRWRPHAQYDGGQLVRQDENRPAICAVPEWADVDGAVAAGCFCPFGCRAGDAESAIPRAAFVAGKIRRAFARLPRIHRQRMQSAADLARPRAYRQRRFLRAAEDFRRCI